jgi:hypothetical protein
MPDLAARPEATGRKAAGPNLLLLGYDDDDTLTREELAREWQCATKTIRRYQAAGLAFIMHGGKVIVRVEPAREFIRGRERRPAEHRPARRGLR